MSSEFSDCPYSVISPPKVNTTETDLRCKYYCSECMHTWNSLVIIDMLVTKYLFQFLHFLSHNCWHNLSWISHMVQFALRLHIFLLKWFSNTFKATSCSICICICFKIMLMVHWLVIGWMMSLSLPLWHYVGLKSWAQFLSWEHRNAVQNGEG